MYIYSSCNVVRERSLPEHCRLEQETWTGVVLHCGKHFHSGGPHRLKHQVQHSTPFGVGRLVQPRQAVWYHSVAAWYVSGLKHYFLCLEPHKVYQTNGGAARGSVSPHLLI